MVSIYTKIAMKKQDLPSFFEYKENHPFSGTFLRNRFKFVENDIERVKNSIFLKSKIKILLIWISHGHSGID